jgi:hypothetical protein
MKTNTEKMKRKIISILRRHDVVKAAIFGSYARGEAKKGSDLDLLVQFGRGKSLLDLAGLQIAPEESLKMKVDVLTYNSPHPLLKDRILDEQEVFYEERP